MNEIHCVFKPRCLVSFRTARVIRWFNFLSIVIRAAMRSSHAVLMASIFKAVYGLGWYVLGVISLYHVVFLLLAVQKTSTLISIGAVPVHLHWKCKGFPLLESTAAFIIFSFLTLAGMRRNPKVVLFVFFLRVGMFNMLKKKHIYTYQCFIFSFWELSIQCHF